MSDRIYGHFCALARSLDVVGDRWTLLLVRELLGGPKRHAELKRGLPGIASNLLSERLRALQAASVIERAQLGGAPHYRLTERGRALQPVLVELARWGAPLLPELGDEVEFRASWLALTLEVQLDRTAVGGEETALRFRIDGDTLDVAVDRDGLRTPSGRDPDIEVAADRATFLAWGTGRLSDSEALAAGLCATGGVAGLQRVRELFSVPEPRRCHTRPGAGL
jgi:DNA-binding HxlR family transcriptional regulator